MKSVVTTPLLASVVLLVSCGPAERTAPASLVIEDVTVIPADGSHPMNRATVVIEGETITAVAENAEVPNGARIIDGGGKYLIPGLWENHIHLSKTRPSAMKLLVVNGVTSVRDLGGDIDEVARWRAQTAAGERVGPTIYMAGSYLESPDNYQNMLERPIEGNVEPVTRMRVPVDGPAEARRIVGELAARDVDLIKVRAVKNEETFVAIGQAAAEHGLKFAGHTMGIPLPKMHEAGVKSIEHFFIPFLDDMPAETRREHFEKFAQDGVAFVPNLTLFFNSELTPNGDILAVLDDTLNQIDPRRAYLSKYMLKDWREQLEQDRSEGRKEFFRRLLDSVIRDAKEMRAAGVDLLPGTDTAVLFIFPGWALHEELALYVEELDYTPREAIEAATRESAGFMDVRDTVGTIEPGQRADLVLLDANPLDDIRNTKEIEAVFLRGRHFGRAALDSILESVKSAPDVLHDDWGRYVEEE